jgi:hypothetical protein
VEPPKVRTQFHHQYRIDAHADDPDARDSASSSPHGFHPDGDRLCERKTPDDWYAHDSDTDNIPGYPEQEDVKATRDEDHKQRYAEKNARIEALKFEVEKTRHEDLQLQADTRRVGEKLARMKSELKRLQPQQANEEPPEFYMRPAKVKKGKKK